jgi:hypothetical protein
LLKDADEEVFQSKLNHGYIATSQPRMDVTNQDLENLSFKFNNINIRKKNGETNEIKSPFPQRNIPNIIFSEVKSQDNLRKMIQSID